MANFERYEEEFKQIITTTQRNIGLLPNLAGEKKKMVIKESEKELEEAESLLKQMEIDANNSTSRLKLQQIIKGYQGDVQRMKRELQKSSSAVSQSMMRNDLLAGGSQDYQVQYMDQRQALLAGTDKLNTTTNRVANAHRVALETENIGTNVLGDLYDQRQKLQRANDKLDNVNDDMKQSRSILSGMARRVATNKLILAIIIVMLMGIIGMIIYMKWIRKP